MVSGFAWNEAWSDWADHDGWDSTSDNHEYDRHNLLFIKVVYLLEIFGGVVAVADSEYGLGGVVETLDVEFLEGVVVLVV